MTAEQQNAREIRGSSGDLTYADLRDSFGLDDSFYEARREIWAIVQQNISDMAHSMREGVVALHGAQSAITLAEAAAASPPESEMAKSVGVWLGETSNAEWLEQCRSLIVRHVGVGTPTLGLSALKTAGNIAIAEMLRRHCTDIDHYHRLSRVMYTLAAIQDVIIANVHQTYLRSVATARLREQSARFRDEIAGTIGDASRRSAGLRDAVNGFARSTRIIVDGTSEIVKTSDNISVAMTEASQNASHLLTAIEEASNNVTVTASVADQAFQNAEAAVTSTATLSDHAGSIDSILSLIRSIAGQTNLLALNATIEAARAGDAGRGFAVVAQEVKSLASQTAQATGEIAKQIEAIQASAGAAIGAMTTIRDGIVAVHKSTTEIRGAMEKNALTATMISDSIHDTARSVALTSKTVQDIMSTTTSAAGQMETVDVSFAEMADQMHALDRKVQVFVGNISMEG